ncbi:cell division protein FtsZ [Erythrobacter sp. LQ02-29]|uniref:cell division protein FtsZ n=1 Tax=Erythrobacter sp. LQ02-29 TaxID=2920384 RepID=UPI001F4DB50B|nr:cell division protein FtsZ [Erythrobacter sp. LQ02-29]MCP9222540.1 cell division protein FtsZ [Erythrobacter sp. LQ02-29]
MSINIGPASGDELRPRITVIGVGGAGGNAIANMMEAEVEGVDFIVANTDAQALNNSTAEQRIQLGPDITGGLGAGARPEVGKAAAEETLSDIEGMLEGVNMCFIAAGMGGGTGTGAAPVIAEAARRMGVLTVGVVTKPFLFEGTRRMRAAESGIEELQKHVDTLIVIPNQNLFLIAKAETTFKEAFQLADEVLQQGVRSITDLMVMPGLINLDFADVKSVMEEMGKAMMGTGEAEGENRALEAAERAIANPLLDGVSMAGAKGVIISIIGGEDMRLLEVDEAANHIRDLVDEDANIIWGSAFNPDLDGKIRVSVVATGIDSVGDRREAAPPRQAAAFGSSQPLRTPGSGAQTGGEAGDRSGGGEERGATAFGSPAPRFDRFDESADEDTDRDGDRSSDDLASDALADLRNDSAGRETAAAAATDDSSFAARPGSDGGYPSAERGEDDRSARAAEDDEALDLAGSEVDRPHSSDSAPQSPASRTRDSNRGGNERGELLLGDEAEDGGAAGDDEERGGLLRRGRRLADGEQTGGRSERPELPRKSPGGGGTLFERMANLSRGSGDSKASRADADGDDDDSDGSLNIPRFLGRQNNQ